MSHFHLTEYEFLDVRRMVNHFFNAPLYSQRRAAEDLVVMIGDIYDKARARALHEAQEEAGFVRRPSAAEGK
jgi:hypothetical protein